ncbi:MAG: hypothetical protein WKF95_15945 [Rubrobacter sp.]
MNSSLTSHPDDNVALYGVLGSALQARRFGLPEKGRVESGADADLTLVDLGRDHILEAEDLF